MWMVKARLEIPKPDNKGIDIYIKSGTKRESLHMPVLLSQSGLTEVVYNDFHIGEDCDVTIIAGCGIHNGGDKASKHDGIHSFFIGKGSKVKYVEKHYGSGDGNGERIMNPQTIIEIAQDGYMEMDTVQIKGVDSTERFTKADLAENQGGIIPRSGLRRSGLICSAGGRQVETVWPQRIAIW